MGLFRTRLSVLFESQGNHRVNLGCAARREIARQQCDAQESAPGRQGYVTASEENEYLTKMQAAPSAALLDPTGEISHLYDAKTSPQMVVINPQDM